MSEIIKSKRILAIDLLRGYFLFVMIVDHLMRFPGLLDIFTGRGGLWVSAAEGFFFVSGMMIGLVRGQKIKDRPMKEVSAILVKRSLKLYLWAIGLTLFFTIVGSIFINNPHIKGDIVRNQDTWTIVFRALTLQYAYGWADFLQHYSIYLALSPLAIWLLRKQRWYAILALSILAWFLRSHSTYFAWQIFFFSGVVVGFYLKDIEHYFRQWPAQVKIIGQSLLYGTTIFTLLASVVLVHGQNWLIVSSIKNHLVSINAITAPIFVRAEMNAPRVLLFLVWFSTAYTLVRRYENIIDYALGWLLVPFGQNSLYVYIVQAILIYLFNLIDPLQSTFIINTLTNFAVVALIWLMVKKQFLFSIIPR